MVPRGPHLTTGCTHMKRKAELPITWSASFGHAACINCTITKEEDYEFKNAVWSQIKLITNYKDASALPHKVMHLLPATANQKNRNPIIQSKTSRQQMHAAVS